MSWQNAISFINVIIILNIVQQYQGKYSSKSMQYRPLNPFQYPSWSRSWLKSIHNRYASAMNDDSPCPAVFEKIEKALWLLRGGVGSGGGGSGNGGGCSGLEWNKLLPMIERLSKWKSAARERSEQCRVSKWLSGANERVSGLKHPTWEKSRSSRPVFDY